MAYCRCSDNCDLYIYKGFDDCFHVHTACYRSRPKTQEELLWTAEKYKERGFDELDSIGPYIFEPLQLPFAGTHFKCVSINECLAKIQELRDIGYKCPSYVDAHLLKEKL